MNRDDGHARVTPGDDVGGHEERVDGRSPEFQRQSGVGPEPTPFDLNPSDARSVQEPFPPTLIEAQSRTSRRRSESSHAPSPSIAVTITYRSRGTRTNAVFVRYAQGLGGRRLVGDLEDELIRSVVGWNECSLATPTLGRAPPHGDRRFDLSARPSRPSFIPATVAVECGPRAPFETTPRPHEQGI